MALMTLLMALIAKEGASPPSFYRFGPQPDLVILGYTIDEPYKYAVVVLYALANTVIRNLNHNVIAPWITLNIQDSESASGSESTSGALSATGTPPRKPLNKSHAYEISIISTVYSWFDWLIYIHMLMAQVDMVIIEMGADVIATTFVTRWYIEKPENGGYHGMRVSFADPMPRSPITPFIVDMQKRPMNSRLYSLYSSDISTKRG